MAGLAGPYKAFARRGGTWGFGDCHRSVEPATVIQATHSGEKRNATKLMRKPKTIDYMEKDGRRCRPPERRRNSRPSS